MPPHGTPVLDFDPDDRANLPEGGMGCSWIHSVMDTVEQEPGRAQHPSR